MTFDAREPLDAAGVILRGLAGQTKPAVDEVSVSLNNPVIMEQRFRALVGL